MNSRVFLSLLAVAFSLSPPQSQEQIQVPGFLQDSSSLSREVVDYIVSDVEAGVADPADAQLNLEDLMADGTVTEADGTEALAEIDQMLETEAYDGNIYTVTDPTFGEDVTLDILEDVESGSVSSPVAIAQLAVMVEDEWISEEEYEWASEESIRLESLLEAE